MFSLEKTEKDIMNLFGLITAIKSSAENVSSGDDEENVTRHTESVAQLCDIASEKLSNVWKDVSDIETPVSTDAKSENGFDDKTFRTAEMISFLITDESVPAAISDALADALADLENTKADNSPEYISKILSDYSEAQSK